MIDIPVPMITGNNDTEKINSIISYLQQLSTALERELMSIDYSNLSIELSKRIENSLTEHQDLSAYATKAYVEKML